MLIHSDGTRIIATERKGSYVRRAPRYVFSNRSEDILGLFRAACDALARGIPGAQKALIAAAGHLAFLEKPAEVLSELRWLLS